MTIINRIMIKYLLIFCLPCVAVISVILIGCGNKGSHGTLNAWTDDNQAIDAALQSISSGNVQKKDKETAAHPIDSQQPQQQEQPQQPQQQTQSQQTQQPQQSQQQTQSQQTQQPQQSRLSRTINHTPPPKQIKPQNQLPTTMVNINEAAVNDLEHLPGIGPNKAKAIIDFRKKSGLFHSKEDIMKVKGIGPSIFAKIADKISVQ